METTPQNTAEELRDGAIDIGKSTSTNMSSAFTQDEQEQIHMAIGEAEEYDPVLVLKWNQEWLNLPGNIDGKWKEEQILA